MQTCVTTLFECSKTKQPKKKVPGYRPGHTNGGKRFGIIRVTLFFFLNKKTWHLNRDVKFNGRAIERADETT